MRPPLRPWLHHDLRRSAVLSTLIALALALVPAMTGQADEASPIPTSSTASTPTPTSFEPSAEPEPEPSASVPDPTGTAAPSLTPSPRPDPDGCTSRSDDCDKYVSPDTNGATSPVSGTTSNAARKNPRKVKILGGSAAERRLVRKLLVRYAHHTHIVKVTLRSSVAGRGITTSYRFKSNRILSGRSRIVIQTGGGLRRLRQVATHEIAHASQLWAYRGTTLTRTRVIFNRTIGGTGSTGLERGADCAVIAIGERSSALPYQNSCTRAQRRAARGVLAGRRIQQR